MGQAVQPAASSQPAWRAFAFLVLSTCSFAQLPPAPAPEPTVITVTGHATPVSSATASVTVLTREQIEASHADNVGDLLRQVPFLFLTQSGARGGLTTVTLRGGKPNFTLVMIDGIPVNDITNVLGGSYDFSNLSTDLVEQVEIVRGPLSSLYGSDAAAGVINIISRHGEGKARVEAGGLLGNFATRQGRLAASGKVGKFDYAFGGSYFDVGEQVYKDAFQLGTIGFQSHLTVGSRGVLRFLARYQNSHQTGFPTNGGGPEFSILRDPQSLHTNELVTGLEWRQQLNARWFYLLSADVFDRTQNSVIPAIYDSPTPNFLRSVPAETSDTDFRRLRANFSNSVKLAGNLTATLSTGWRREDGDSTGYVGPIPDSFHITRDTGDGVVALEYLTGALALNAAMRLDKADGFRAVYSPTVGGSYRLWERGPRLKSSFSRGFKLPSFYSLADRTVGNPLLKPEFSRSVEVGVDSDFFHGRLQSGLTFFRNDYRNLVDFSAEIFKLVNRSQAQTQGVEFSLNVPVSNRVEFGGHFSYLDWTLEQTTEPLRDQPHWRSGASLDWRITRRWRARAESLLVGRRYDFEVPVPNQPVAGGYATTNLVASYAFPSGVTAFFRAENLLNQHYHEFVGFPNPGIYARFGLTWRVR